MKNPFHNFFFTATIPILLPMAFIASLLVFNLVLSFWQYSLLYGSKYIGLENYIYLLLDPDFQGTIIRTFIYTGVIITANLWFGLGLALLTEKNFRGVKIVRTIIMLPICLFPVAASTIWVLMYDYSVGIVNHFIAFFGFERQAFLADPISGFISVMVTDIWGWTPFMYIILLAGLQTLPKEPFEAAALDGASPYQTFRYLTLPLMTRIIMVAVLLKSIDIFRAFDYIYVMTKGGPGYSTCILSVYTFRVSFEALSPGRGAASAVLAIIFGFSLYLIMVMRSRRESLKESIDSLLRRKNK